MNKTICTPQGFTCAITLLIALGMGSLANAEELKPRVLVLTDISTWETDDHESLIRFLAHADLFEIEGIVISTGYSVRTLTKSPENGFINLANGVVDAYEQDLPNLMKRSGQTGHAFDDAMQEIGYWPSPNYLRDRVMLGSLNRGKKFIGDDNGSPGSDLIIKLADEDDSRPLWVTIWGGGNTLAQSIYQVKKDRKPEEYKAFLRKLRAYAITDQDRHYRGEGLDVSSHGWIYEQAGDDLRFIWDESAWKAHNSVGKSNWDQYEKHIQNHGNLGSQYPKYAYGVEGDTPAFLYLLPNGLNDPEDPTQASWGGNFTEDKNNLWREAKSCESNFKRFYPAAFNNFAARMDWAKAGTGNRNPHLVLDGDSGINVLSKTPAAGTAVTLDASKTSDPDGDRLKFQWWVQDDAGSYAGDVKISDKSASKVTIQVPSDAAGKSFHVICEVRDDGTHNLSSYRRVIFKPTGTTVAEAAPMKKAADAKPSADAAASNDVAFRQWLFEFLPKQYPDAKMTEHTYWMQAHIGDGVVASWTEWTEDDSTLKAMEAHNLVPGKAMFIEQKGPKNDWGDNPAVTYYEGAGYYISGYDPTTMSDWDGKGLSVIQFDGDAKALASTIAMGWAREKSFADWLYQYLPVRYPNARMTDYGKWKQAHITEGTVASWEKWTVRGVTLKYIEDHSLAQGKSFFIEKSVKTKWADHPSVTYYPGAGYFCSGYDTATMGDWGVDGLTVIQFDGDCKEVAEAIVKGWTDGSNAAPVAINTLGKNQQDEEPAAGAPYTPFPNQVVVTKVKHFDNMCWKIAAAGGTWYFENGETGGTTGFSSAFDQAGNDWIGNDADRGHNKSSARGGRHEYRGWPNFGNGNFNHPQRKSNSKSWWVDPNGNEVAFDSKLAGEHLIMRSANANYDLEYHFFPTHAAIKVLKAADKYAFLFEGPIGGEQEASAAKDSYVLKDGEPRVCKEGGLGFLEPEFGNKFPSPFFYLQDSALEVPQVWYAGVNNAAPDSAGDEGWRQGSNMVIFSFGRDEDKRAYTGTNAVCVFGFHPKAPHQSISNFIESRLAAPFVQVAESSANANPTAIINPDAVARINSTLDSFVESGAITGVSALVFEKNREAYFRAFGMADEEAGLPMSRDTIVQIFSMTKPITGVALMTLHEKGAFKLDDPVSKYIPSFANLKVATGKGADTYEQHLTDLLPLREDFRSGRIKRWGRGTELPRSKYQMNGSITGLTSTNCPGINWGYPEADRHHRQRLDDFHRDHIASLIWFLQHDDSVPKGVRNYMLGIGLHDEEFVDNGHWPWQLYVRQGRRIEGRAIITQHNFTPDPESGKTPTVEGAVAMGEHSFDVHPCHDRRFLVEGYMEGVLWYPKKADGPAQPGQIPYDALLPKLIDNLLVPVAMSCTHVAMSVLRMEPVWMTTGQVAGLAAAEAHQQNCDVASLDPAPLPKTLGIQTSQTL